MIHKPGQMELAMRKRLAALARDGICRFSGAEPGRPARWQPGTVCNPKTGVGFTEAGAWEFIAVSLENSAVGLETVELRKPPGATAYAMIVPLSNARVYFKVEIVSEKNQPARIIGRSFHEEDPR